MPLVREPIRRLHGVGLPLESAKQRRVDQHHFHLSGHFISAESINRGTVMVGNRGQVKVRFASSIDK